MTPTRKKKPASARSPAKRPKKSRGTPARKKPARKKASPTRRRSAPSQGPTGAPAAGAATPPRRDFGPSASSFSRMTAEGFSSLIQDLIREEATTLGIPAADIIFVENTFTKDGGVDAEVRTGPSEPGTFLPARPVIAQFKRGTLKVAGAKKEVSKHPRVRDLVQQGFAYRLILGADADGRHLAVLKETLVKAFTDRGCEAADLDVQVLNGSHLADWVAEYPALSCHSALHAAGEPTFHTLQSVATWQLHGHDLAWRGSAGRDEEVQRLCALLAKPRAVVRVVGPPGAGKTRFALEAIRRGGFEGRTLYSPAYHDDLRDLFCKGAGAGKRKGLLVVDECTTEQALRLEKHILPAADLRLLTIGASEDSFTHSSDPRVVTLKPLDIGDAEAVAKDRLAPGAQAHASTIAARSNGFPKLVALLCEVVRSDADAIYAFNPGQHDRLVAALKKLLGDAGTGSPVQMLCVPRQFGCEGTAIAELDALGDVGGCSRSALLKAVDELTRRALVGRAADYAYVTPFLLADWLAGDLWKVRRASLFHQLRTHGMSARGLRSALRRLIDLGLEQDTLHIAQDLLSSSELFGSVTDLDDEVRASFINELATLNPGQAAALLGRLLRAESRDRLLTFTAGRRHVVWALQKCAWAKESFAEAAWVLLKLAAAEVETYGNNAVGVLNSLLLTHLGATEASGTDRIAWLTAAWNASDTAEKILLLGCARRALDMEGSGESNPFPDQIRRDNRWMPATWEEEHSYRAGVASVLRLGLASGDSAIQGVADAAASHSIRALLARDHGAIAVSLVRDSGERARTSKPLARTLVQVRSFDLNRISEASKAALVEIEAMIAPTSLEERLAAAIGIAPWDQHDEGMDVRGSLDPLAKEFIEASVSSRPWQALDGSDPQRLFEFGSAVGRSDRARVLLPELLSRAADAAILRLLAAYMSSLPSEEGHGEAEDVLDQWAHEAMNARVALEATWLAEPSPRGAKRLVEMLRSKLLDHREFGRLLYGGWLLRVPTASALEVLAALDDGIIAFNLCFQLWHHSKPADALVAQVLEKAWMRLEPADVDGANKTLDWEWKTFGENLVSKMPAEVAQRAVRFLAAGERTGLTQAASELLAAAVGSSPTVVWPVVADVLEDPEARALAYRIGHSLSGRIDRAPIVAAVMAWTGGRVERARLAASLVSRPQASADSLASALLEAHPGDQEVMAAVSRATFSGSFWGPAEAHYRALATSLESLLTEGGPGLQTWAQRAIGIAEQYARGARKWDESYLIDS